MSETQSTTPALYKATRPDGTDFRTGTVSYAAAFASGEVLMHPRSTEMIRDKPKTYLSVSVEPAATLVGGMWPARLFRVEAVGDMLDGLRASKYKRAVLGVRVVEELPGWMTLGPNGEDVARIIERARVLTRHEAGNMDAAWCAVGNAAWGAVANAALCAVRGAAWDAVGNAVRGAVGNAVRGAVRGAVRDAVVATLIHDLITTERYDALMGPWRAGVGEWA